MLFDKLCAISEKFIPEILPALHAAKIIQFPGRWHEIAAKMPEPTDEEMRFLEKSFFLPFQYVAVEDSASCVLMWDAKPNQEGWGCERYFVECLALGTPLTEFADGAAAEKIMKSEPSGLIITPDTCVVSVGKVTSLEYVPNAKSKLKYSGKLDWLLLADKREVLVKPDDAAQCMGHELKSAVLRNVSAALEEMFYFNSPERFVVSSSPPKVYETSKNPRRVIRSPYRSLYTLLTPHEIRERIASKDPVTGRFLEAGHDRRKHYRTFRSDFFVNKKGQRITIPAQWVGPSEGEYKGRRYKVCLDL